MNTRVPINLHSIMWCPSCDVGNGLIDAIWRLLMGDGLQDATRRSVDRITDSLARACIPVVEEDSAGEC